MVQDVGKTAAYFFTILLLGCGAVEHKNDSPVRIEWKIHRLDKRAYLLICKVTNRGEAPVFIRAAGNGISLRKAEYVRDNISSSIGGGGEHRPVWSGEEFLALVPECCPEPAIFPRSVTLATLVHLPRHSHTKSHMRLEYSLQLNALYVEDNKVFSGTLGSNCIVEWGPRLGVRLQESAVRIEKNALSPASGATLQFAITKEKNVLITSDKEGAVFLVLSHPLEEIGSGLFELSCMPGSYNVSIPITVASDYKAFSTRTLAIWDVSKRCWRFYSVTSKQFHDAFKWWGEQ